MPRCIDANALQAQLERKKAGIANQRYIEGWNDFMMRVKSMVSKAPTIDVAPVVYGRWIHLGGDEWCCSACGLLLVLKAVGKSLPKNTARIAGQK